MRPVFPLALLLALPCLGGCIFPYCAYPTLSYTPKIKLDAPPSEVRAFRVDFQREQADVILLADPRPTKVRLTEIPVTHSEAIPAQFRLSASSGLVIIGVALNYVTHTSHSMALRLYRPGYKLVEVASWQRVNRVDWQPAPTFADQEETLEQLFPIATLEHLGTTESVLKFARDRLFPPSDPERSAVSLSPHVEALRFGVAEYERLRALAADEETRARLAKKAVDLLCLLPHRKEPATDRPVAGSARSARIAAGSDQPADTGRP